MMLLPTFSITSTICNIIKYQNDNIHKKMIMNMIKIKMKD